MKNIKVVIATMIAALWATSAIAYEDIRRSSCRTFTAFGDGYDEYFAVGFRSVYPLDISFDANNVGGTAGQTLTFQFCSTQISTSCYDFDFDTTGNGIPNTNILSNDPLNILTSGIRNISGFNFLRIQETDTYTATSSFTVCRHRS